MWFAIEAAPTPLDRLEPAAARWDQQRRPDHPQALVLALLLPAPTPTLRIARRECQTASRDQPLENGDAAADAVHLRGRWARFGLPRRVGGRTFRRPLIKLPHIFSRYLVSI